MQNNKLKVWSKKIKADIDSQKDDIYKRDYKFYKIDRLEQIAERIDEFSDECSECNNLKSEVEDIVANLSDSLQNGNTKLRSEYEKRNEKIVKHLRNVHELSYKEYYVSVYSFIGFVAGTIVLGFIGWLILPQLLVFSLLTGFTIGIITGRLMGKRKDKEQERNGLIL